MELGVSSSSSEAPRLSSATPSVCTVSEGGTRVTGASDYKELKFTAAGTCTIVASTTATGEYEAAEARVFITVPKLIPQAITLTSTPPSSPVAGVGSYTVSARSSSGLPVDLRASGACTFKRPDREVSMASNRLDHGGPKKPEPGPHSPTTVYFAGTGRCEIRAAAPRSTISEYESAPEISQTFNVNANPAERITFTSTAPKHPVVDGSYEPAVVSAAAVAVEFLVSPRSVCATSFRDRQRREEVSFQAPGTCTVRARALGGSPTERREAKQSFTIFLAHPPRLTEQKLAKALKACKKDVSKSKRRQCETAAYKAYEERAKRETVEKKRQKEEEAANREAEDKRRSKNN